jgi:hypothetical protein
MMYHRGSLTSSTLSLLCEPELVNVQPLPKLLTSDCVQALWAACPLSTRQALLKLPVLYLWPAWPAALAIDQFFAAHAVPLDWQASHVMVLLERRMPVTGLEKLWPSLLNSDKLARTLSKTPPDRHDIWWLDHALYSLVLHLEEAETLQRPRALPAVLDLYRRITLDGASRVPLWPNWMQFLTGWASLPRLEAQDWVLAGTYLPLGPDEESARLQVQELSQATNKPFMVHLLQGWLAQRFAEACDPSRLSRSGPAALPFQCVWELTKELLAQLSSAERQALGKDVKVALRTLAENHAALISRL